MHRFSLFVSISLNQTHKSNILLSLCPIHGEVLSRSSSSLPHHPRTGPPHRPRRPSPGGPTKRSSPIVLPSKSPLPVLSLLHMASPSQTMLDSRAATLVPASTDDRHQQRAKSGRDSCSDRTGGCPGRQKAREALVCRSRAVRNRMTQNNSSDIRQKSSGGIQGQPWIHGDPRVATPRARPSRSQ
jgi:hypothetical protein